MNNPHIVRFSNERARPLADQLVRLHYMMLSFADDFRSQRISEGLVKSPTSFIEDGSDRDGRTPITGEDLADLANIAEQLADAFKGGFTSRGESIFEIASRIQVNGSPR